MQSQPGLDPGTSPLGGERSTRLSYWDINGGSDVGENNRAK